MRNRTGALSGRVVLAAMMVVMLAGCGGGGGGGGAVNFTPPINPDIVATADGAVAWRNSTGTLVPLTETEVTQKVKEMVGTRQVFSWVASSTASSTPLLWGELVVDARDGSWFTVLTVHNSQSVQNITLDVPGSPRNFFRLVVIRTYPLIYPQDVAEAIRAVQDEALVPMLTSKGTAPGIDPGEGVRKLFGGLLHGAMAQQTGQ